MKLYIITKEGTNIYTEQWLTEQDVLEHTRQGFNVTEKTSEYVYMGDHKHRFRVVTAVPRGYHIWNINGVPDGWLPLCRLKHRQPFEGAQTVDDTALVAVRCTGTNLIMQAIYGNCDTLSSMQKYIKRYGEKKTECIQRRVARMRKAVPHLKKIKWD